MVKYLSQIIFKETNLKTKLLLCQLLMVTNKNKLRMFRTYFKLTFFGRGQFFKYKCLNEALLIQFYLLIPLQEFFPLSNLLLKLQFIR